MYINTYTQTLQVSLPIPLHCVAPTRVKCWPVTHRNSCHGIRLMNRQLGLWVFYMWLHVSLPLLSSLSLSLSLPPLSLLSYLHSHNESILVCSLRNKLILTLIYIQQWIVTHTDVHARGTCLQKEPEEPQHNSFLPSLDHSWEWQPGVCQCTHVLWASARPCHTHHPRCPAEELPTNQKDNTELFWQRELLWPEEWQTLRSQVSVLCDV